MRLAILTILFSATSAWAQWGIGLAGASQCPYSYRPGAGAINGNDEISNLKGKLTASNHKVDQLRDQLKQLNRRLNNAKSDMRQVLSEGEIRVIEEHHTYNRSVSEYRATECSGASAPSSGGVLDELAGNTSSSNAGGLPTPGEFCPPYGGKRLNLWTRFALDGGQVSASVCDYTAGFTARADATRAGNCKEGLRTFYEYSDRKTRLETQISQATEEARDFKRKLERINDEIAEGTYCPYCAAQRRGYSTSSSSSSLTNSIIPMVGILAMAALGGGQNRQPAPPQMMPFQGAYPANPYPAVTPGYMGVTNGMYGALPGGIGAGAFGCQGTSPYALSNPYAAPVNPFLNGMQQNPFSNPYANPFMNPTQQNSMFLPGFGPGFGPVLGNGINGYNPYQPYNPYQNTFLGQQNPLAPGVLPYPGATTGLNSYFQNPYQFNPYGNYGANTYAPGVLPYLGGGLFNSTPPYGAAYGTYPSYGAYAPYYGTPWGNSYTQIGRLQNQIGVIQNSPTYGGNAPAILPYPSAYGGSAVYNLPGTSLNPVPTNTSTVPNIIRSN